MNPWLVSGLIWAVIIAGLWYFLWQLPKPDADEATFAEKRFRAYVQRAIDKANVGAVNADQWVKDLVAVWRSRV